MVAEDVIVILAAADKWLLNHLSNPLSSPNFSLKILHEITYSSSFFFFTGNATLLVCMFLLLVWNSKQLLHAYYVIFNWSWAVLSCEYVTTQLPTLAFSVGPSWGCMPAYYQAMAALCTVWHTRVAVALVMWWIKRHSSCNSAISWTHGRPFLCCQLYCHISLKAPACPITSGKLVIKLKRF